jgi:hypothetical protein
MTRQQAAFLAVDPMAEATDEMSVYQYGNNNPVMINDPMGDLTKAQIESAEPLKYADGLSGGFWKKTYGSEQDWSDAIQYFWDNNLGIYNHRDNSAFWNAVGNAAGKFWDKNNSSLEGAQANFDLAGVSNDGGYNLRWNTADAIDNVVGLSSQITEHNVNIGANQGGPGPRDTPGIKVYYIDGGNSWSYPGLGIHVNKNERNLTGYIQHEYGHYLQYLKHGASLKWYNKFVAIPSMQSLQQGDSNYTHDRLSFELEATTLAHDFYGKNSVLNNYNFPTFYNFPMPLDHDNSPPTDFPNVDGGFASGFHP